MNPESMTRTAVAMSVITLDTLVCGPAAIALGAALGPTHPLVSRMYREYARVALAGCGATVRAAGEPGLDPGRRYVFVANHTSHLDALAILTALPRHGLRFVAKDDLSRVPVFGQALRATGNVFVARSDTQRDIRALEEARRELVRHISVLFFAEGHRARSGELAPFKKGAAVFALKTRLALVPIGVHGAFDICPPGFEVKRSGAIGVAIGDPIEVRGRRLADRDALTDEVRDAVQKRMAEARDLASR